MISMFDRFTSRQRTYAAAGAIALVGIAAGYGLSMLGGSADGETMVEDSGCTEVLYWFDPMVPDQRFEEPGRSPFMDMQLVPKCADGEASAAVRIDPGLVQNFGIRTAKAEYGELEPELTVTGVLAFNGRDVAIVQPRLAGYVQRTYDLAPDDVVARGAPLVDILVPEWGGAQQEYLAVLGTGDEGLARAMRERMRLLGMSEGQIAAFGRSGRARSTVTVTAPIGGAITMLGVRPGMTVMAGQTLAEITGFSPIWLEAAVPEAQAARVRLGQAMTARLTAFPDETLSGRIIAILPSAEDASRTITVRAELPNPTGRLKPGMFAKVVLSPETRRTLLVPSEAVIRTGRRAIVMVKQGEGGFMPAEVRLGREAGGRTEVLAGLAPGEAVVTSGQFLLDSEASLSGLEIRPIDAVPQEGEKARSTKQSDPATYRAEGTIERISGQSVTLNHEPVPELDWPSMTMAFEIEVPTQLRDLKRGDRVQFSFTRDARGPRILSIRKFAP
ncbi:efflux RND transporter periplasmic adaptor subunit [Erythrobacter sp.]|uniref:efflux RND transporter periplasmic adaptor subunit n=1 Tax=Erythrobacter sp. TaxID=1042 RepID=UPI00311F4D89